MTARRTAVTGGRERARGHEAAGASIESTASRPATARVRSGSTTCGVDLHHVGAGIGVVAGGQHLPGAGGAGDRTAGEVGHAGAGAVELGRLEHADHLTARLQREQEPGDGHAGHDLTDLRRRSGPSDGDPRLHPPSRAVEPHEAGPVRVEQLDAAHLTVVRAREHAEQSRQQPLPGRAHRPEQPAPLVEHRRSRARRGPPSPAPAPPRAARGRRAAWRPASACSGTMRAASRR